MKIVLFLLCLVLAYSQNSIQFQNALQLYTSKKYKESSLEFKTLQVGAEKDPAFVMQMFSEYAQQNYADVKKVYAAFLFNNPNSTWIDEANYIYAKSLYQLRDYYSAIEYWLKSLDQTESPELTKKIGDLALNAIDKSITREQLLELQKTSTGERSQAVLCFKAAEYEESIGKLANAKTILQDFVKTYPNSAYSNSASEKILKINSQVSNEITIGVLLPLTELPEICDAIFNGIQFALQEKKNLFKFKINLKKVDVGSTVLEAINACKNLAEDQSIVAIIGPLESDKTAACALIANKYGIPLLTPSASQNGISDLSKFVFQLNSDDYTVGKLIAEYAFNNLKKRSFAILNAQGGKSEQMARGFSETLNLLGAELVSQQFYYAENAANLYDQFKSIRNAGIKKMFRDSLESVNKFYTVKSLDSLYNIRQINNANTMIKRGTQVDSAKIAVKSIDAIFMPINTNDNEKIATIVSTNYATNLISSQLLGNQDWLESDIFTNVNIAKAMNNLLVMATYFIDTDDKETNVFVANYKKETKTNSNLYSILGYRTCQFLISALNPQDNTRTSLHENLINKDGLKVFGGNIDFNLKERVNSGFTKLQLLQGKFKKIE